MDIEYTEEIDGYMINIYRDEFPRNPRTEWGNFGTIVYRRGARNAIGDVGYDESGRDEFARRRDVVKLPIFACIHGGITVNTTGFSCPWDSGQSGWIFADYEKIRKEFGVKRVTKKVKEKIENILRGEIETYDTYLQGDVWYVEITKGGDVVDGVGGIFGIDYARAKGREMIKAALPREIQTTLFETGE